MVRIGTSGWSYDHWEGILYPHGVPQRERLDYYLRRFDTVEVNSTYYHWPRDSTFSGWRERLPEGFLMTVKAPRGLTHSGRLRNTDVWLERIERGARCLGDRLGILFMQLPPDFECDLERLEYFLERAPRWLKIAAEFRNPTWNRDEVFVLLERYAAAYCIMSGARLPCILRATAPFVYLRLHGPDPSRMYAGSYSEDNLRWWADRIGEWAGEGRDVFAYFNNDWEGNAVRNAVRLRELAEQRSVQR